MYSTPNDVRNALAPGDWGGDDEPANTHTAADLSDGQLTDEIRQADSRIDLYIGRYYATPVALVDNATPEQVRAWSRDLAAYLATLTYRRGRDLAATDPVALRYAATMTDLIAIRDGKANVNLPTNGGDSGAGATAGAPINPYSGTMFGPGDFDLVAANRIPPDWPYAPYRSW